MLASGLVVIYLITLGAVVMSQRPLKRVNVLLFTFSLVVSLWLLSLAGITYIPFDEIYSRMIFAIGISSFVILFLFVRELTRIGNDTFSQLFIITYVIAATAVVYVTMATAYVVGSVDVTRQDVLPTPEYGPLGWMYMLFVAVTMILIMIALIKGYASTRGKERQQIMSVAIATVLASVVALMTNLIIPAVTGNTKSSMWLPAAVVCMMTGLTYAIVRNGLFDIKLVVVRTAAYILSIATLAFAYFGMAYVASVTFFHENVTTGISTSPINIVLALILAFLFQPIKQFFDRWTNKIFYRNQYEVNDFIARLGRTLTTSTRLNEVLDKACAEIRHTLKASTAMFVIYRHDHPDMISGDESRKRFGQSDIAELHDVATLTQGKILNVAQLEGAHTQVERHLHSLLTKRNIAIVLPLVSSDELIGYLLLGEHQANGYTKRDIDALATIADELVIAVQNARSVQAIRELNRTLERRVDNATKELRESNKSLIELDATKDEFVSMASHQLRTPLTSVKGYLSMVLEGDAGKLSPDQRKMINEAYISSDRMVRLIGDFLNVSRIQTGKFVLDKHQVYLADVVEQEITQLQSVAAGRNVTIVYRKPRNIPVMELDEDKVRQVVMNYIDNAIFYSHEGSKVIVTLRFRDGEVEFAVKDSGIGIPKDQQAKLFQRFFRADNARKHRPDGTGVGLYLAKKVISEHDGKVFFESTAGKGSTFGFRLYPTSTRTHKTPAK